MKTLRVLLGFVWYGRIIPTLADALREKGVRVTGAIGVGIRESVYSEAGADVYVDFRGLRRWQRALRHLAYCLRFVGQHDAFIFLYGESLFPYNVDLPLLRLLGKKTIMWFIGSDVRDYGALEAAARKAGLRYYWGKDIPEETKRNTNTRAKIRMIHRVEQHVNYVISYPSISQLLTRKYYTILVPVDINTIRYNSVPNPRPLVVHAPSDVTKKGTSYIIEAVQQLKKEGYDFEFRLFQNTPNSVVREALTRADIAVDQMFETLGAVFAIEAMAAGCAVLGGNIPELSGFPRELPIIHTDPDTIYDNLKMLLENPELRRELGENGRKYVEKYHDSRKIADQILQLLSGDTQGIPSITPDRASL